MKLAERMQLIPASGTIRVMEIVQRMLRDGRHVHRLDIGDPGFDTPPHIQDAAIEAIRGGGTHYTPSRGTLELREAIAEDLAKRHVDADPIDEIIVTPGSKHAVFCACFATLNPGDEVLILSPSWPTHFAIVQSAGAKPVEVPTGINFSLDVEALQGAITAKTRMIVMNSPNNPTGGALDATAIKAIADLAVDADLLVLADEIYDRITYDGFTPRSIASLDGLRDRTVTVNGLSKTYAMTGWRLGFAAANAALVSAMVRVQGNTTTCPASFVQRAAVAALTGPQDCVAEMVREYQRRRDLMVQRLRAMDGIACATPPAAFYAFPDVTALGIPSQTIVERLLEHAEVSAIAGSVFGHAGEGHLRLSYAMIDAEAISRAMDRFQAFVEARPSRSPR
jgi:aspartate/methionine/tyrosine aminotransferase